MKGYYLMPHPPIMVPEVGKGKEVEIQKTIDSCKVIGEEIASLDIDTIVIITPHGTVFSDAVSIVNSDKLEGNLSSFGAKSVSFSLNIDKALTRAIITESEKKNISIVELNESNAKKYGLKLQIDHGVSVPLYYVKDVEKYNLVHITYGMLSPIELYSFGMVIEKACIETGIKAVLIASGDLSHRLTEDGPYPYSPLGSKFDNTLIEILKEGKFDDLFTLNPNLIQEAGECGLRSLYILAGALDSKSVKGELLSYEGPFGVGYGVMRFSFKEGDSIFKKLENSNYEKHKNRLSNGNSYTKLARRNLEYFFKNRKSIPISEINDDELLNDKKGVFVSLKIAGELRGCIGTIEPATENVAHEILNNSLSAAFNDPRFSPLREKELYEIDISVDLLYPAQNCNFDDLDPKNYGVIVTSGRKKGLLLPDLEGIDTKDEQVKIALKKAGIREDEQYNIERFKVVRFKEVGDND